MFLILIKCKETMRIALISPYSQGAIRGNIVTVQRVARVLAKLGIETITLAVDSLSVSMMKELLIEFNPDLIHAFHAHYCGGIALQIALEMRLKFIITITGSDLHDSSLRQHPTTLTALQQALAITCFHNSDADKLVHSSPDLHTKVVIIPQGVEPLPCCGDYPNISSDSFVLLLPAALRPVKCVEFPIGALQPLAQQYHSLQLVIAGGIIDDIYAKTITNLISNRSYVTWLGEVPHEFLGGLYNRADLVLNSSLSESMSNSLMEAMALGRPVLASNIQGNASLINNGKTGWLYNNESEFQDLVVQIKANSCMREKVGQYAQKYILKNYSPRLEAKRYALLYKKLLNRSD